MGQRVVVTEDPRGLRTLRFEQGGARQSVVWPGEPLRLEAQYTRMSMVGLAFVPRPERILIIGLGGGAIPMFLRAVLPDVFIDVVDVEPEVVEAAKLYCGFQEDASLHAHVADGRSFIESSGPPYSLIFLDAYGPDSIPPHLATREFLGATRARLTPDGAVVGNVWESESNPLFHSMLRTWQVSFPELHRLDVPGTTNRILVGLARPAAYTRADVEDRAARVEHERRLPFELGRMVTRGYRTVAPRPRGGHILTDAAVD